VSKRIDHNGQINTSELEYMCLVSSCQSQYDNKTRFQTLLSFCNNMISFLFSEQSLNIKLWKWGIVHSDETSTLQDDRFVFRITFGSFKEVCPYKCLKIEILKVGNEQ